jgi:hypothetical protein
MEPAPFFFDHLYADAKTRDNNTIKRISKETHEANHQDILFNKKQVFPRFCFFYCLDVFFRPQGLGDDTF